MFAFEIIEHLDVIEHVLPCIGARFLGPAPYPLALEQVEEAFGDGVVMAVPAPARLQNNVGRLPVLNGRSDDVPVRFDTDHF